MEQKQSIVKSSIYQKAITGPKGEGHIFEITFENGDKGQFITSTKTQNAFIDGQEAHYTIETKVNGKYTNTNIKPVKTNGVLPVRASVVNDQKSIALGYAVDLANHDKINLKDIAEYAKSFMKFLSE